MNLQNFKKALNALCLAVQYPKIRKPKSLLHATGGYRQGTDGESRHIQQLAGMTLEELFDLCYELEQKTE